MQVIAYKTEINFRVINQQRLVWQNYTKILCYVRVIKIQFTVEIVVVMLYNYNTVDGYLVGKGILSTGQEFITGSATVAMS